MNPSKYLVFAFLAGCAVNREISLNQNKHSDSTVPACTEDFNIATGSRLDIENNNNFKVTKTNHWMFSVGDNHKNYDNVYTVTCMHKKKYKQAIVHTKNINGDEIITSWQIVANRHGQW